MTTYRLPSQYTARELVYAIRHAKAHPDDAYQPATFGAGRMSAQEFVAWFRQCLHVKITNAAMHARYGLAPLRWRKLSSLYQTELKRDAWRLQGPCGMGTVLETPEVRKRLAADHVHWYVGGTHRLCADRQCENRH